MATFNRSRLLIIGLAITVAGSVFLYHLQNRLLSPFDGDGQRDLDYQEAKFKAPFIPDCNGMNSLGTHYQKLSGLQYIQLVRSWNGSEAPPLFLMKFKNEAGKEFVIYVGGLPDDAPFVYQMRIGQLYTFCALPLGTKEKMLNDAGASFVATARTIREERK